MLENEWQRAMGELPEEMIGEAADAYQAKRKRPIWVSITSVAAAILIVVSMLFWPSNDGFVSLSSGITVYAYGTDGGCFDSATAIELVDVPEGTFWTPIMSNRFGIPITCFVDETLFSAEEITMEMRTDSPMSFSEDYWSANAVKNKDQAYCGSYTTVKNGETIYWGVFTQDELNAIFALQEGDIYTEIIVKANGEIVGYVVIMLEREEVGKPKFNVRLVESEMYPTVNGKKQNITEEYIQKKFEEARNK